jgi:hypothetical protein
MWAVIILDQPPFGIDHIIDLSRLGVQIIPELKVIAQLFK